jgi:hypothetical protein
MESGGGGGDKAYSSRRNGRHLRGRQIKHTIAEPRDQRARRRCRGRPSLLRHPYLSSRVAPRWWEEPGERSGPDRVPPTPARRSGSRPAEGQGHKPRPQVFDRSPSGAPPRLAGRAVPLHVTGFAPETDSQVQGEAAQAVVTEGDA